MSGSVNCQAWSGAVSMVHTSGEHALREKMDHSGTRCIYWLDDPATDVQMIRTGSS